MCRHLAYLGPPRTLSALVCDPPRGLLRQSWEPRRQRHGTVNADGFGVGWYADGDPCPARYRSDRPMWSDPSLPELARVIRSRAVLAAVRDATDGMAHGVAAAAPFRHERYLFSHNGAVPGWPDAGAALAGELRPVDLLGLAARTDSAVLFALVCRRLSTGRPMERALAEVASLALASTGGRVNLLITDGQSIAATAAGDTLCYRVTGHSVVVASEPDDDQPGWHDVPDRTVLLATTGGVRVSALDDRSEFS